MLKDRNRRTTATRIANGSLSALARQACPSGRREGILFFFKKLLVLSLPRGDLGAKRMADLVAGSYDGNLFPHAVLILEETTARVVNGCNDSLGHVHLFLFASGNVVFVGKFAEHFLECLVSGVARANSGLAAQNVFALGLIDAGAGFLLRLASWRRRRLALFSWAELDLGGRSGSG